MSAQHTQTPWQAINASKDRSRIEDTSGRHIADLQAAFSVNQDQMRADAVFIVKACNNYGALVSALQMALNELSAVYKAAGGKQHTPAIMDAALAFAQQSQIDACLCKELEREDRAIAYAVGSQSYNAAGELEFGVCVVDRYAALAKVSP